MFMITRGYLGHSEGACLELNGNKTCPGHCFHREEPVFFGGRVVCITGDTHKSFIL